MRKFTVEIEIECDNAAFNDNPAWEIIVILRKLTRAISERDRTPATVVAGAGPTVSGVVRDDEIPLFDSNGNRVGRAMFSGEG